MNIQAVQAFNYNNSVNFGSSKKLKRGQTPQSAAEDRKTGKEESLRQMADEELFNQNAILSSQKSKIEHKKHIKQLRNEHNLQKRKEKQYSRIQQSIDEVLDNLKEVQIRKKNEDLVSVKEKWNLTNRQKLIDIALKDPDNRNFTELCKDIAPHKNLILFVFNRIDDDGTTFVSMLPSDKFNILMENLEEYPDLQKMYKSQLQ